MFYSQFILAKKGPLGTIWIAAHLERKLRKNQVTETNISVSVDSILCPEVPIALRLSGHLLLGVVRIYSRKVNYLFHDCSEALVKIKQAFHSGAVDLPPEAATAPFHSITLPETFDLDDLELLPDREALFLANSSIDHHVTSREQITLQDSVEDTTYLGSEFGLDERFPEGDARRLDFDMDVFPAQDKGVTFNEDDVLPVDTVDEVDKGEDTAAGVVDLNEAQPLDNSHDADAMELEEERIKVSAGASAFDINVVPLTEEALLASPTEATSQVAPPSDSSEDIIPDKPSMEENGNALEDPKCEAPSKGVEAQDALQNSEVRDNNEKVVQVEAGIEKDDTGEDKETLQCVETAEKDREQGEAQPEIAREQVQLEVPEIEKVRSAAEVPELEPNILELPEGDSTPFHKKADEESATPVVAEDTFKLREVEETPILTRLSPQSMAAAPEFPSAGDDDLLASILGRRTPSLRVAPTPPAKRHKPGPKPGTKKRKVRLDESMVLHSDYMRLQLSDTSNIRRVRKRAPCTEYEIWSSEKEILGQQMFDDPLIPGPSDSIRETYRCVYSAGESDATELSAARQDKYQLEQEENHEPITLEEEPFDDYSFYETEARYRFEEDLQQHNSPRSDKDTETKNEAPTSDAAATNTETVAIAANSTNDLQEMEVLVEDKEEATQLCDKPGDGLTEEQNPRSDEQLPETVAAGNDAILNDARPADGNHVNDNAVDLASNIDEVAICNQADQALQSQELANSDTPDKIPNHDGESDQLATVASERIDEQRDETVEEMDIVASGTTRHNSEDANEHCEEQHNDTENIEALDFLVDSKDEDAGPGDDPDDYYPEEQAHDNSGWSVRTRAVCQYLRVTFETMETSRKERAAKLGLERLLQGKTRRESARMFFESLVLKTKDYIHVEQKAPFDNIFISARPKLMKADI